MAEGVKRRQQPFTIGESDQNTPKTKCEGFDKYSVVDTSVGGDPSSRTSSGCRDAAKRSALGPFLSTKKPVLHADRKTQDERPMPLLSCADIKRLLASGLATSEGRQL